MRCARRGRSRSGRRPEGTSRFRQLVSIEVVDEGDLCALRHGVLQLLIAGGLSGLFDTVPHRNFDDRPHWRLTTHRSITSDS